MKRLLALALMVAASAVAIVPSATANAPGATIEIGPNGSLPEGWHCERCDSSGTCYNCHWDN